MLTAYFPRLIPQLFSGQMWVPNCLVSDSSGWIFLHTDLCISPWNSWKPTGSDAKLTGIAFSCIVPCLCLCWYQQLLHRSWTVPPHFYSSACCSGSDESFSLLLYYWCGFQQLWTNSCWSQQVFFGFIRTVMAHLAGINISCMNSASSAYLLPFLVM